ncbi:hypothetical protein SDJN03_01131, partial [Cucurbita argyrosperma subsp. sororia]
MDRAKKNGILKKKVIQGRGGELKTTAGEKKKIGRTTPFRRQSTTPAVRRRIGRSYTTLSSYSPDMNKQPGNYVYSRDVYNSTNPGFTPTGKIPRVLTIFLLRSSIQGTSSSKSKVGC